MRCLPSNQAALLPFSRPFSPEFLRHRHGREAIINDSKDGLLSLMSRLIMSSECMKDFGFRYVNMSDYKGGKGL